MPSHHLAIHQTSHQAINAAPRQMQPYQMHSDPVTPRHTPLHHSMPTHTTISRPVDSTTRSATITSSVGGNSSSSRFTPHQPSIVREMCYICNTKSSQSFVDLYRTTSRYSNTVLFDFVRKFMHNQPSVRENLTHADHTNWHLVCAGCLNLINEYDSACTTAAIYEQLLGKKLYQTEMFHAAKQQNIQQRYETDRYTQNMTVRQNYEQPVHRNEWNPDMFTLNKVSGSQQAIAEIEDQATIDQDMDDIVHVLAELSDDELFETIELSDDEKL